jgi:hypothetical protein
MFRRQAIKLHAGARSIVFFETDANELKSLFVHSRSLSSMAETAMLRERP